MTLDPDFLVALNETSPAHAALSYAEAGWAVFPVSGIVSDHCGCRAGVACDHPAKHPLVPGGARSGTTDPAQLRAWWRSWPWAGVGLPTGARTGLVVVDLDPDHGARESVEDLARRGMRLSPTLSVATGGGGRHLLYAHPGTHVSNLAGELPGAGLAPGVDLRGDGGYVVAPPSLHLSGQRYRWRGGTLVPLPAWLLPAPTPSSGAPPVPGLDGDRQSRYVASALAAEVSRVRAAVAHDQGGRGRNDTLNKAAFALGTLTGAGVLDPDRARESLLVAAISIGLRQSEAMRTIASGLRAGAARPRRVPDFEDELSGPGRPGPPRPRPVGPPRDPRHRPDHRGPPGPPMGSTAAGEPRPVDVTAYSFPRPIEEVLGHLDTAVARDGLSDDDPGLAPAVSPEVGAELGR